MARLTGVCTGHKWPPDRQTANSRCRAGPLYYFNLLTNDPFMARLLNAARVILVHLVFANEKAWNYACLILKMTERNNYDYKYIMTNAQPDDHKLLQESHLTVRQPRTAHHVLRLISETPPPSERRSSQSYGTTGRELNGLRHAPVCYTILCAPL